MPQQLDWQLMLMAVIFLLIVGAGAFFHFSKNGRRACKIVDLPNQDLAVFTQIRDDSVFTSVPMHAKQVSRDMLIDRKGLVGSYLIEPVKAHQAIQRSQVVIPPSAEFLQNTTVVTIPVNAAMVRDGKVSPGRVVTIWGKPQDPGSRQQAIQIVPKALVLKARQMEVTQYTISDKNFIVMLVIPYDHLRDLMAFALSETVMLTPVQ